jgi:superfamily II DNA/RNA helicase
VERVDTTTSPLAGGFLRFAGSRALLDERLAVTHWRLAVERPGFTEAMSRLIAVCYLSPKAPWAHPNAGLAARLPRKGTVGRKGDFGEIVAGILYAHRLGRTVPFQRLEAKPIRDATLQGADLLALTLDHRDNPEPTVVEVKYRAEISPAKDLKALAESLASVDEDYLVSAWAAGVALMEAHPDEGKAFALSAAQQLAQVVQPDEPVPPHDRQAVIVTAKGTLTGAKIKEHWGTAPPVSELHIITVPDLETVMDQLYEVAASLQYADAASGVPALLGDRRHFPGIAAPVSSTEARKAIAAGQAEGTLALVEAALWLLADWDGMGVARAHQIRDHATDETTRGLAQILTGAIGTAVRTLGGHDLLVGFATAVQAALRQQLSADKLRAATSETAEAIPEDGLAAAVRYVGAAVAHRLPRHPGILTAGAGATGHHVQHVVARMQQVGRYTLWPSQAAAISGGLLDRAHPALAIRMPTSAGKTALIELLIADQLDSSPDTVIAVLAPTKALVSQLSSDLRQALPATATVRSSHGGLDFDTEEPSAIGILSDAGVAVMTPERFDLEWRRATTGDENASISQLGLLVVDEAHLITASRRGAPLELVIARALRRRVRVVLLSAQFPRIEQIAAWIEGKPIQSNWTPTWLERLVYFPNKTRTEGRLQAEIGDPYPCLTLSKIDTTGRAVCAPGRPTEAAALAKLRQDDGLVVLYSNQRNYMDNLVAAVEARSERVAAPNDELEKLASELDVAQPYYASLLRSGIGVHHARVPREVRQAVEKAARKNLLNFVVCTSTLLEGVDFPTRTVIAVYPTQTRTGQPEVARLRNLAGRAGRAGRFTQGTLIVMLGDESKVPKWLKAFRLELPATHSALERALRRVRAFANQIDVLEVDRDTNQVVADLDAIILAAAVEGAVIDGDLRRSLEELLGRTLWWAGTTGTAREQILTQATQRATHVARIVGGDPWRIAFYRAGLPLASSVKLRDALAPHVRWLAEILWSPDGDHDESLLWLASVAPAAPELASWQDLPQAGLRDALRRWLAGEPTTAIRQAHPEVWQVIEEDLETLLPWVLTAVIEFIATAQQEPELRDLAHQRLGVARLRYGVPDKGLCDHVRRGADRVLLAELAAEFAALPVIEQVFQDRDDFITARLAASIPETATTPVHVVAGADEPGESALGSGAESAVPTS